MAKLIVEIDMGSKMNAEQLKDYMDKNRDDFFPIGGNFVSVDRMELKTDPTDNDFYLFKLLGVIDHEDS